MISDVDIGTEKWLQARREYVTASDCATIVGANPFESPGGLLRAKLLGEEKEATPAMKRGNELEPAAREAYIAETKRVFVPCWKTHPDRPWMAATLDGLSLDEQVLVEIKCGRSSFTLAKKGKIPPYYEWQMEHQLSITGLDEAHYVAYDGKEMIVLLYEKNPAMQEILWEKEEKFWEMLCAIRAVEAAKKSR